MNKNLTEIVCIVDRSGSMSGIVGASVEGFNKFIAEQRIVPGEARATVVLFNNDYEFLFRSEPLGGVKLDQNNYKTFGTTALLDAVGRTIDEVGNRLAKTAESDRPANVIVLILTDGQENASKDYSKDRIKEMITLQQSTYNWKFYFLGANQDSFAEADKIGIGHLHTMNYVASDAGAAAAYSTISNTVTRSRTGSKDDGLRKSNS